MPISRARWVRLRLILLASLVPVLTQVQYVRAQDAPDVTVEETTAESDFPEAMKFQLSAAVEGEVERVDLVYQQASLETFNLVPADFEQDGENLEADASAEMAINFVPAGIDLTYRWAIAFSNDSIVETDANVVTWTDDRFEWDRIEAEGVELYMYDRSDDFAEFARDVASEAIAELTDLYQPDTVLPLRIWLYETREDFAGTFAANSETWAAGASYPSLQVILAVIPRDSESEVLRIIPHEISHQLLHQATKNPFNSPATWIDEGLAVLAQTGGQEQYLGAVVDAYEEGELLSLASLNSSFPFDASDATLAYGESYLVMEYVASTYGRETISDIIAGYAEGASHEDVIGSALGMSIEDLQIEWESTLDNANRLAA
jgi:hypothetical protein